MSKDTILRDAEGVRYSYDNIKTQGWLDGHEPGAEVIAGIIKERAVKSFAEGRDKEAVFLRSLAEEIVDKHIPAMKARAKKNEKDHPEVMEAKSGKGQWDPSR